jgi:hypothetical protein
MRRQDSLKPVFFRIGHRHGLSLCDWSGNVQGIPPNGGQQYFYFKQALLLKNLNVPGSRLSYAKAIDILSTLYDIVPIKSTGFRL